jgi:hypothetical protein
VVQRWQQLPLDHALSGMPRVRLLLDHLAGAAGPVPDLGPAVVMDQLTVLVYDACEAGSEAPADLAAGLGDLLRDLG